MPSNLARQVLELMEAGSILNVYATARVAAGTQAAAWRPPLARALRHAAQMFRALEYLHGRAPPLVHRDVKPANLLVTADLETLKLGDFGVTSSAATRPLLSAHLPAAVKLAHAHTETLECSLTSNANAVKANTKCALSAHWDVGARHTADT